jgi:hypothetical protein
MHRLVNCTIRALGSEAMRDLIFVLLSIGVFVVLALIVRGVERL